MIFLESFKYLRIKEFGYSIKYSKNTVNKNFKDVKSMFE